MVDEKENTYNKNDIEGKLEPFLQKNELIVWKYVKKENIILELLFLLVISLVFLFGGIFIAFLSSISVETNDVMISIISLVMITAGLGGIFVTMCKYKTISLGFKISLKNLINYRTVILITNKRLLMRKGDIKSIFFSNLKGIAFWQGKKRSQVYFLKDLSDYYSGIKSDFKLVIKSQNDFLKLKRTLIKLLLLQKKRTIKSIEIYEIPNSR